MADDIVSAIRRTVGRVETYEHTPLMAAALSAADEIERLHAEAQAMRRFIQETAIVNGITVDDSEHRFWRLSDGTYMPQSVIDLVWNSEARHG